MKLIYATAMAIIFALPAQAQECAPRPNVMTILGAQYGEAIIDTRDMQQDGRTITWDLWASVDAGTWSLTGTASGVTCLVKHGKGYSGQTPADLFDGEAT